MLPEKNRMPDLEESCPRLLPAFVGMTSVFDDPDPEFGALRRLIVFGIDRAVGSYQAARSAVVAQLEELSQPSGARTLYMFGFAESIEYSLVVVRRLFHALERLKNHHLFSVDRTQRRFLEHALREMMEARDFIEHAADIVTGAEAFTAGSLFPRLTADDSAIEVGGHVVTFTALAGTLTRMHAMAKSLIEIQDGRDPAAPDA